MQFRDYSFGCKILGEGSSSIVYRARKYKSKQQFAIKVIKEECLKSQIEKRLLNNQIKIYQSLNHHENIVNLVQHAKFQNSYLFVLQLCEKGSLANFLENQKVLSETEAIYITREIIKAYKTLYDKKIMHRDIKPANILITQTNQIKLCDFGLSTTTQDYQKSQTDNERLKLGTPCFMAPEVVKENIYTFKADFWAIGITFYRMIVGQLPYKSFNNQSFLKEIKQKPIQGLIPQNISEVAKQFLIKTLKLDHQERISANELFNFDFQKRNIYKALSSVLSEKNLKSQIKNVKSTQRIKTVNQMDTATCISLNRTLQETCSHADLSNYKTNQSTSTSESNIFETQKNQKQPLKKIDQQNNSSIGNLQSKLFLKPSKKLETAPSAQSVSFLNSTQPIIKSNHLQKGNLQTEKTNDALKTYHQKEERNKKENKVASNLSQLNIKTDTIQNTCQEKKETAKDNKRKDKITDKFTLKQMENVTKIILSEIDFVRFMIRIKYSLGKYFKGEFQELTDALQYLISYKVQRLRQLSFVQEAKLSKYVNLPLYKEWVQLIKEFTENISKSRLLRKQEESSNLQVLIQNAAKEIFFQFDKSIKTRLNVVRLLLLDYLICLKDLLQINQKGEQYFLKHSMISIIFESFQNMKVQPQLVEQIFLGISKKLINQKYF